CFSSTYLSSFFFLPLFTLFFSFFFFTDTATTVIYTLSLHDALPIYDTGEGAISPYHRKFGGDLIWELGTGYFGCRDAQGNFDPRSEEHTSELQSRENLVCRLLLEKKKKIKTK